MLIKFATFHQYTNEMFLRGEDGTLLFLNKDQQDLQDQARQYRRGQKIYAEGEYVLHKVLCSRVFAVSKLTHVVSMVDGAED